MTFHYIVHFSTTNCPISSWTSSILSQSIVSSSSNTSNSLISSPTQSGTQLNPKARQVTRPFCVIPFVKCSVWSPMSDSSIYQIHLSSSPSLSLVWVASIRALFNWHGFALDSRNCRLVYPSLSVIHSPALLVRSWFITVSQTLHTFWPTWATWPTVLGAACLFGLCRRFLFALFDFPSPISPLPPSLTAFYICRLNILIKGMKSLSSCQGVRLTMSRLVSVSGASRGCSRGNSFDP